MRVITGKLKGRKLHTVPSSDTRPTSDKIKEAIFHIMGPYFDGGSGLDLFAGSGSLGIEGLSRGLEHVTFIDHSPLAIQTVRKNIRQLQLETCSNIYRNDALRALDILARKKASFDLIFIDPPYQANLYEKILEKISQLQLLKEKGILYVEHPPGIDPLIHKGAYEAFFSRAYSKEIAVSLFKLHS